MVRFIIEVFCNQTSLKTVHYFIRGTIKYSPNQRLYCSVFTHDQPTKIASLPSPVSLPQSLVTDLAWEVSFKHVRSVRRNSLRKTFLPKEKLFFILTWLSTHSQAQDQNFFTVVTFLMSLLQLENGVKANSILLLSYQLLRRHFSSANHYLV